MLYELIEHAKNIYKLVEQVKDLKTEKKKLISSKAKKELVDECNKEISNILEQIKEENSKIYFALISEPRIKVEVKREIKLPTPTYAEVPDFLRLTKEELKKYLQDLNITREDIKRFILSQKKRETEKEYEKVEYVLYRSKKFAKVANRFVEKLTIYLTEKFPDLFKPLFDSLKLVNINMLSKSYVSTMIFSSFLSFLVFAIIFSLILLNPLAGIAIGFVGMIATFAILYYYPTTMINSRKKKIKNELPFAIIHMAAVAGSGTQPINIFTLLLESGEYKEIGKEIKKIINYVNLFGYNLTTALKAVALTTPSPEFRELLNGIISSLETGGDLRGYLDGKAVDALATYKLERQKYVETLATYSDVYTGIAIAAPLLFVTTLTIINVIGGQLGGLTIPALAAIGTFGLIPALNVGFMIFLNVTQPEL